VECTSLARSREKTAVKRRESGAVLSERKRWWVVQCCCEPECCCVICVEDHIVGKMIKLPILACAWVCEDCGQGLEAAAS
jgi:hypothetical protein